MREMLFGFIGAVFASGGFWALITKVYERRQDAKKKDTEGDKIQRDLMLALAHDRLYELCTAYIARGSITVEEYDNLRYIYSSYHAAGGNGTGDVLFSRVDQLPFEEV